MKEAVILITVFVAVPVFILLAVSFAMLALKYFDWLAKKLFSEDEEL